MIDVPAATPVAMPDTEPTVATAVLELLHVPPSTVVPNVLVKPVHTGLLPVIGPGPEATTTFVVASSVHPETVVVSE